MGHQKLVSSILSIVLSFCWLFDHELLLDAGLKTEHNDVAGCAAYMQLLGVNKSATLLREQYLLEVEYMRPQEYANDASIVLVQYFVVQ